MEEPQNQLALLPAPCHPDESTLPQTQVLISHDTLEAQLEPLPYPQNDYRALIDALPSSIHLEEYEFVMHQQSAF
jgi:hypothetical protein